MGLRHPFAAARAVQTLDHVSGGRAEIGIGAGWLEAEWRAAGQDFGRRGACLDECLRVCKRLWTEDEVEHHGEFFDFQPVVFEPKPLQKPWPPILVGGESRAALRRAALFGDGWIGMGHSLESIKEPLAALARLRQQAGTAGNRFAVTVSARLRDRGEVALWEEAGVDRILVAPWKRSPEAAEAIRRFADVTGMEPQA
jgi:probable F420-dependent oxidoreductase